MNISKYTTLVFDCDGVVLDSNQIKTEAFRTAAQPFGEAAAEALVAHHVANGGISRYAKFAHFIDYILPRHAPGQPEPETEQMLATFAAEVRAGMERCSVEQRRLARLFDGGIFGSPDTKAKILEREIHQGNVRFPALFLGDSRHDHEAALGSGLDFVFVHRWTEFQGWKAYCRAHSVNVIRQLGDLLSAEISVSNA